MESMVMPASHICLSNAVKCFMWFLCQANVMALGMEPSTTTKKKKKRYLCSSTLFESKTDNFLVWIAPFVWMSSQSLRLTSSIVVVAKIPDCVTESETFFSLLPPASPSSFCHRVFFFCQAFRNWAFSITLLNWFKSECFFFCANATFHRLISQWTCHVCMPHMGMVGWRAVCVCLCLWLWIQQSA